MKHEASVRLALVGAGTMGSLHARVIAQSPRARLAYIVDPAEREGRALAEQYHSAWLPDVDSFDDVDGVIVASPTSTHVLWAMRALECGRPVLVEKPLADSLAECELLIAKATRRDIPLMCGLLERFNAAVQSAVSMVDDPIHVTVVRHSHYLPRIKTGVARDLVIHDADTALRIAGAYPHRVRAQMTRCRSESVAEDIAEVNLGFPSGMLASLSASRVSQRKIRFMTIAERDRLIEIDLLRLDITIYRHVEAHFLTDHGAAYRQQTVVDIPIIQNAREPLASQLDHFIDLATGAGDPHAELLSILPPHQVVEEAIRDAAREPECGPFPAGAHT